MGHYPSTPSEGSAAAPPPVGKWVCAQSSHTKKENHNQCITEKLEVLAKAYSIQGDKWRALGYAKAISALKSYHKPVMSYEVTRSPSLCEQVGLGQGPAGRAGIRPPQAAAPPVGVGYRLGPLAIFQDKEQQPSLLGQLLCSQVPVASDWCHRAVPLVAARSPSPR